MMTLSTVSSSGSWALLEEAPTSRDCFAAAETESSWAEEEEVEEEEEEEEEEEKEDDDDDPEDEEMGWGIDAGLGPDELD